MKILVINAGSSSLKYQLINMDTHEVMAKGLVERIGIEGSKINYSPMGRDKIVVEKELKDHADAIQLVIESLIHQEYGVISTMKDISAVGHRVVHGGEEFSKSVIIDDAVKAAIEKCAELAPLHNGPNLVGIKACEKAMPGVPMVAVFDTSFHQTMPKEAYMYAIPYKFYKEDRIRRYGFHGTSHKYVMQRAAAMMNKTPEELKIITIHLGNGSSIAAVKNGKSVDTTMGFTPLAGLMMGTRSGDIDPAILTYLMDKKNLSANEVNDILNKESGVYAISGVSSDFRDIEAAANEGNERAILAQKMFIYQVKRYIGAYAAAMGGVDALVFTAGVGENNEEMRAEMVEGLEFMGIEMDLEKNNVRGREVEVSKQDSRAKIFVIPTNEELMIAKETQELL